MEIQNESFNHESIYENLISQLYWFCFANFPPFNKFEMGKGSYSKVDNMKGASASGMLKLDHLQPVVLISIQIFCLFTQ